MKRILIKIYTKLGYYLLVALNHFFQIRIGELESRKVGHFASPPYIYICEQLQGIVKTGPRDYYFLNKTISNSFLLRSWEPYFKIKPRIILEPIFHYAYFKKNFKLLTPYRSWRWHKEPYTWQGFDINNATVNMPSLLNFSDHAQIAFDALIENFTKDQSWNGELITFHIRSPFFQNPETRQFRFSLRDSNFSDFQPAIESLLEQGYAVFRMGKGNFPFNKIKHPRYVDLSLSPLRTDELDFFVLNKTFLHICTASGMDDSVATLFKKKVFVINGVEWKAYMKAPFQFFAPKKFFCRTSKKYLSLRDSIERGLDLVCEFEVLDKMNIQAEGLSSTEIQGCVNEAVVIAKSETPRCQNQEQFLAIAREAYGTQDPVPLSQHFLTSNPWFLK